MDSKSSEGAACKGKRIFSTYQDALNAMATSKVKRSSPAAVRSSGPRGKKCLARKQLTVYRCGYCGGFHLGHAYPRSCAPAEAMQPKRRYELPNPPA